MSYWALWGNFLRVCSYVERSTEWFCGGLLSSEQCTSLLSQLGATAGHLCVWETCCKWSLREREDSKKWWAPPQEYQRHLSKVQMKLPHSLDLDGVCCLSSCAWLWPPCQVQEASPPCPLRNKSYDRQDELFTNALAPKAPWAASSGNIWESELYTLTGNCTCWWILGEKNEFLAFIWKK